MLTLTILSYEDLVFFIKILYILCCFFLQSGEKVVSNIANKIGVVFLTATMMTGSIGSAFAKETQDPNSGHSDHFINWTEKNGLPKAPDGILVADIESNALIYVTTDQITPKTGDVKFTAAFGASSNVLKGYVRIEMNDAGTFIADKMVLKELPDMGARQDPSNMLQNIGYPINSAVHDDIMRAWDNRDPETEAASDIIVKQGYATGADKGSFAKYARHIGLRLDDIVLNLDEEKRTAEATSCVTLTDQIGLCLSTNYNDVANRFNNGARIIIKDDDGVQIQAAETKGHEFSSDRERGAFNRFMGDQQSDYPWPTFNFGALLPSS